MTLVLQRILMERCLLGLRRLSDPYQDKRGENKSITVRGFSNYVGKQDPILQSRIDSAMNNCDFARNLSNKLIAHADLATMQGGVPLEDVSRRMINISIDKIAEVIKWVCSEYMNVDMDLRPISQTNDERDFLKALYFGAKVMREQRELYDRLRQVGKSAELQSLEVSRERIPDWLQRDDP
ncbi:hypothetical protein [Poseidonocella sedimentorum]|uniref:AbiU2 domain-containing protein n=1 Tax=Poseidonocella sedimentorum TaxID=871652 RepID=UPI002481CD76|nr:hypothetical protein [Poseidonocella sedimentorum]